MPEIFLTRSTALAPDQINRPLANTVRVNSATDELKFGTGTTGTTEKTVVDTSSTQSLAAKTLTDPVVTGNASSGLVVAKTIAFVEDATSLTHTASVTLPAGAELLDIICTTAALWTGGTATLKVGDTAVTDGYFIGVNLKATDLLVGEVLSVSGSTGNWGGKNGAYLVAATGQRGPAATNFGTHYTAGSIIVATVTVGTPATTVGRTFVTVYYTVGQAIAPVLA